MSRLAAIVRASARAKPPPTVNERLRSSGPSARGMVIWIGCHQFGSCAMGAFRRPPSRWLNTGVSPKLAWRTGSLSIAFFAMRHVS